jgi:hypothetical protein
MSYKRLLDALNGIDKALDYLIEGDESEGQGDVSGMPRPARSRIPKLDWNMLGHVAEHNYEDVLGFAQEAKEEGYCTDAKAQAAGGWEEIYARACMYS